MPRTSGNQNSTERINAPAPTTSHGVKSKNSPPALSEFDLAARRDAEDIEFAPPCAPAIDGEYIGAKLKAGGGGGVFLNGPHVDVVDRIDDRGAVVAPSVQKTAVGLEIRRFTGFEQR